MIIPPAIPYFDFLISFLQITLAAGTVLTPLFYEKYSLFSRRAQYAISEIEMVENHDIAAGLATVSFEDKGFDELLTVLKDNGIVVESISKDGGNVVENVDTVEIGHVFGSQKQLAEFFDRDPQFFAASESIIYTDGRIDNENIEDEKYIILRNSNIDIRTGYFAVSYNVKLGAYAGRGFYSVGEQMVHNIMYKWVSDTAQERANRLTAAIVVLWTTILLMN